MTLRGWNSFQYDSTGWTLSGAARTAGVGQSGYAGIQATSGANGNGQYGIASKTHIITGWCYLHDSPLNDRLFSSNEFGDFNLFVGVAGEIIAYRAGWTTTELGRSVAGVIQANAETYIEVRLKTSITVGEVEVRINGNPTPVLNIGPMNVGTADITTPFYWLPAPGVRQFSAWYLLEVDGTVPNTFLGHVRYGVLTMTGNGANSALVGSDGNSVDNYLLVDDPAINHDSDTTYVESPTVGAKDTYAASNLPTPALSIVGAGTVVVARKTDAGSRAIKTVVRSGGVDYQGADEHFLSTSYAAYRSMFLQNPNGPAAWNETTVNAMEAGVEVTT